MKKIIIICFFISLGFAGIYDSLAKNSLKFFKPSIIEDIGNKYGEDGIKELEKVCANKTKIDTDKTSSKLKEATNYILKMDKINEKLLVNIEKLKKEITDLKKSK